MATLEISDLTANVAGRQILHGVDLTVRSGEVHAVMGPNGAGKSTLAAVLMGRAGYEVTGGSMRLDGVEMRGLATWERAAAGLHLVMQYPTEVPGVALDDALAAALVARHMSADDLVQAVHLTAVKERRVAELAYGQQRQLEIALALAGAPRLVLFDEPAAGLSPTERGELVEILAALPGHIGYIIIEHDMDVALRVVESVTMMHNGRIFKEGPPQDIESDPEVQQLYLGGGHDLGARYG